ncbi:hypothetical protein HYO12_10885 [Vibrio parahaemolyticus]|nr:hypothetical protein [Vibrio parahaemolyticus]MBM5025540.1 hypothetical protein [Vibrio parahaemolyticus]
MLKKTMIAMVLLILVSKILGFGREVVLSKLFGVSDVTDAYYTGFLITSIAVGFIGLGVTATFIPKYHNCDDTDRNDMFSTLFWCMVVLGLIITLFVWLFSDILVALFAPGISDVALATSFSRIMSIGIVASFILYLVPEFNRANGDYISQQVSGVILNVGLILSVFLAWKYSSNMLAYGLVSVLFIRAGHALYYAMKKGAKFTYFNSKHRKVFFGMLKASPMMFLATTSNQVHYIIDRALLSNIDGAITRLNYAYALNMLVFSFFTLTVIHVFFSELSKLASKDNESELMVYLKNALFLSVIFILPVVLVTILCSKEIVSIVYQRGEFTQTDAVSTARYLLLYTPFLFAMVFRELISKFLIVTGDYRRLYIEASSALTANFILTWVLVKYGLNDYAILATGCVSILFTLYLALTIIKANEQLSLSSLINNLLRVIGPSLIFLLILFVDVQGSKLLFFSYLMILALIYIVLIFVFNRSMVRTIFNRG